MQEAQHLNLAYDLVNAAQTSLPDSCLHWAKILKNKYLQLGKTENAFFCEYQEARAYHQKGEYLLAEKKFQALLKISLAGRLDSLTALAESGMGSTLVQLSKYPEALQLQLAALNIRKENKDYVGMAASHNHIASVYAAMGQEQRALDRIDQGLKLLRHHEHYPTLINLLHAKANILGSMGLYDQALELDHFGLRISKKIGHLIGESQFYNNMALCYMYKGQYINAELYFYKCLEIDKHLGNPKQIGDSYTCLGELFRLKKEYERAVDLFHKGYELSKNVGYLYGLQQNATFLSTTFKEMGKSDSAYAMLLLANKWKDSIANAKVQSKLEELLILYDNEQKEKTIAQQQVALTNARQTLIIVGALILLAVLSIFTWNKRRRYRLRIQNEINQKEQHEVNSRAIVTAEEEERRRIGIDLHDSIGQLLSAARMNLTSLSLSNNLATNRSYLEKSLNIIDKATDEVRHISHGMVPIYIYDKGVEAMLRYLSDNASSQHFHVHTFSDPLPPIDNYALLLIYRILQEAIQNAQKHSACTEINISANLMGETLSIMIEDNGKGFLAVDVKAGLGLKNMHDRVHFLGGEIEIYSKPFEGTNIHLSLPLQKITLSHKQHEQ